MNFNSWAKAYLEISKRLQSGKMKKEDITPDAIGKIKNEIDMGEPPVDLSEIDDIVITNPYAFDDKNITYLFSGVKSYKNLLLLNDLVKECNNKQLQWYQVRRLAVEQFPAYDFQILEKEFVTVRQIRNHANNWNTYLRNTKLFPNLEYKTGYGGCNIPEHNSLNGVIAPINSAFWSKCYPPNGLECNCYTKQTQATVNEIPQITNQIAPFFQFNICTSDLSFNKEKPLFAITKTEENLQKIKDAF